MNKKEHANSGTKCEMEVAISELINCTLDGDITTGEKLMLDQHLSDCVECRRTMDEMQSIIRTAKSLSSSITPERDLWLNIHEKITADGIRTNGTVNTYNQKRSIYRYYTYAFAAVVIIAGLIILFTKLDLKGTRTTNPVYLQVGIFWQVSNLEGAPKIEHENKEQSAIQKSDSIRVGDYVVTDANSKAVIKVSDIGNVTVQPNSRIKFVNGAAGNNRIQIDYGTIDANINAEPGNFFVEAVSATLVDYGCEYTFSVDSSGDGAIYVREGLVKLESKNRESLVPAGKMCLTKKDIGPGTPYSAASSPEFQKALINFDFRNCTNECVRTIIKEANNNDIYTLISMAPRADDNDRIKIYNMVSNYATPPRVVPIDTIRLNRKYWKDWSEQFSKDLNEDLEKNMEQLQENIHKHIEKSMELLEESLKNLPYQMEFDDVPDVPDTPEPGDNDNQGDHKYKFRFYRKYKGDDGKYYNYQDTVIYFDREKFKDDMKKFKEDMKDFKEDMKKMQKEMNEDMKNDESMNDIEIPEVNVDINLEDLKDMNESIQKEVREKVKQEMDRVKEEMKKVQIEIKKNNEDIEIDIDTDKGNDVNVPDNDKQQHHYNYQFNYNNGDSAKVRSKKIIIKEDEKEQDTEQNK